MTDSPNLTEASPPPQDGSVPDAAVVSLVDAVSHALDSNTQDAVLPIPQQLPTGWVMKESRAQPNYYYYYNMETGESTFESPLIFQPQLQDHEQQDQAALDNVVAALNATGDSAAAAAAAAAVNGDNSRKRALEGGDAENTTQQSSSPTAASSNKKAKGGKPSKVRILHILKKHKGSRRPSSWRQAKITSTKEEATEELQGLMEVLQEETGEDQRATFEELARTESDCSSAKRGGDLGFFGPKKMQPAFEEASFALDIGQLSGIVETSSGVHVLLRIG